MVSFIGEGNWITTKNKRPATNHWQTFSHKVHLPVLPDSAPWTLFNGWMGLKFTTLMVFGTECTERWECSDCTIMAMTAFVES